MMPTRPHIRKIAIYLVAGYAIATWAGASFSQNSGQTAATPSPTNLAPFGVAGSPGLNPAWRLGGLPGTQAAPVTRFEVNSRSGEPALQLRTDRSYGVLTHDWTGAAPAELSWRWRVDQALPQANIATKAGDDAALKVCVMFDQALADIPWLQRTALALARTATGQALPSATVCYLWDSRYPAGTTGANPYSARVRYIVLDGVQTGQWTTQQRRVTDDFQRLFGKESPVTPPLITVAVGADSDNTQGQSLAFLAQLRWLP
jgi:hypothetical protein